MVATEALPSRSTDIQHLIEGELLVKGAAIEASARLNEIPISAAFNASQSFAPSPHIPIF